jgi:hypothetical protein
MLFKWPINKMQNQTEVQVSLPQWLAKKNMWYNRTAQHSPRCALKNRLKESYETLTPLPQKTSRYKLP